MLGLVRAQVSAHDPPWGVRVIFRTTGQQIPFRCQMGWDYSTGVTQRQKPLPQIGSWGLVAFDSDNRSAVWICAYTPSQNDALTTTQASGHAPTDAHIDYQAHFSGDWWMLDGSGNYAHQYVDGSYFAVASGNLGSGLALPTVYRHTVDGSNVQNTIPFTRGDRIPNPPTARNYYFSHISGTNFLVDASGSTYVSGATGALFNIDYGKTIGTIDASGNTTVSGATGANLSVNFGKTITTIDASGNTYVSGAPGAAVTLEFHKVKMTISSDGMVNFLSTAPSGEVMYVTADASSSSNGNAFFICNTAPGNYGGWQHSSSGVVYLAVESNSSIGQLINYHDGLNFTYGSGGTVMLSLGKPGLGFFNGPANAKQTITGALSSVTDANAKAVLTSIISALGQYSLVNNGTS